MISSNGFQMTFSRSSSLNESLSDVDNLKNKFISKGENVNTLRDSVHTNLMIFGMGQKTMQNLHDFSLRKG